MIEKKEAEAPHRDIRMAERGDLHRADRNLVAETRPALLRQRHPSTDEVIGELDLGPRHTWRAHVCTSHYVTVALYRIGNCYAL